MCSPASSSHIHMRRWTIHRIYSSFVYSRNTHVARGSLASPTMWSQILVKRSGPQEFTATPSANGLQRPRNKKQT